MVSEILQEQSPEYFQHTRLECPLIYAGDHIVVCIQHTAQDRERPAIYNFLLKHVSKQCRDGCSGFVSMELHLLGERHTASDRFPGSSSRRACHTSSAQLLLGLLTRQRCSLFINVIRDRCIEQLKFLERIFLNLCVEHLSNPRLPSQYRGDKNKRPRGEIEKCVRTTPRRARRRSVTSALRFVHVRTSVATFAQRRSVETQARCRSPSVRIHEMTRHVSSLTPLRVSHTPSTVERLEHCIEHFRSTIDTQISQTEIRVSSDSTARRCLLAVSVL